MPSEADHRRAREHMVQAQLHARGIEDARVLDAMRELRRHEFVPPDQAPYAYDDRPLPIGFGQTISQPYVVAWMTGLLQLEATHTVLEIGAGCGYQTAVLARLCRHVYAIERIAELADLARRNLARAGVENFTLIAGDGHLGWPEHAPFPRILVAAAARGIPRALQEQLAVGGRLVIPIGSREGQEMTLLRRVSEADYQRDYLGPVAFVPLVA